MCAVDCIEQSCRHNRKLSCWDGLPSAAGRTQAVRLTNWWWQDSNGLMTIKEISRGCDLTISPAGVARLQAAAILCLTVIHILVQIAYFGFWRDHLLGLTPLFDMNQENNIPTWYSGIVLFSVAGALGWSRQPSIRPARRSPGTGRRWRSSSSTYRSTN